MAIIPERAMAFIDLMNLYERLGQQGLNTNLDYYKFSSKMGEPHRRLIRCHVGPPSQIIPAGTDRIFVWSNTRSVYLPGESQTTGNAPYGGYGPLTATTTTSPGTMTSRTGHLMLTGRPR